MAPMSLVSLIVNTYFLIYPVLSPKYLKMLKEKQPEKWIFEELRGMSNVQFRFKDKEKPQSFVCSLATKLRYFPCEEVMSGDYIFEEWKPELIEHLLCLLTPDNIRYAL